MLRILKASFDIYDFTKRMDAVERDAFLFSLNRELIKEHTTEDVESPRIVRKIVELLFQYSHDFSLVYYTLHHGTLGCDLDELQEIIMKAVKLVQNNYQVFSYTDHCEELFIIGLRRELLERLRNGVDDLTTGIKVALTDESEFDVNSKVFITDQA